MSQPWFSLYVNDILGSLRWQSMTAEQRGAYIQLIFLQMQSEDGTLPNGKQLLSKLSAIDLQLDSNSIVIDAFPVIDKHRRANKRALEEWQKRQKLSETRREVGRKGGVAKAKQLHPQPQPQYTSTATSNTIAPAALSKSDALLLRFDAVWKLYPLKKGRQKAFEAFVKWSKAGDRPEEMLDGIQRYMAFVASERRNGHKELGYQHGSTFFNQRGWQDEYTVDKPKAGGFGRSSSNDVGA